MPTRHYTRRAVITNLLRAAAATAVGAPALTTLAQSAFGRPNQRRVGLGQYPQTFQQQYRVPAMSAAISKNGRFVYDHAGGMADREHMTQAQQDSLFRVADLSKPITAVTIFSLIESGKL